MIKMSVFLSSDNKNTVSLEGEPAEIAAHIEQAKKLFQKIVTEYGTKPANGHTFNRPSVSAVSNDYSKPRNDCPHTGGTKILISGSIKNPGRQFVACVDCDGFRSWVK